MNNGELIEYAIRTSNAIKEEIKPKLIDYFYKQKEVIDKINLIIKELYDNTDDTTCYEIDRNRKIELLDILKEVSK